MTAEEIDRLLASWRERLARVDENLIALESEPTCRLLEGRDGRPVELEGMTRETVTPALEAMHELFEQRALLNDVLERARALKEGARLWLGETTRSEIEALLLSPSVHLPPIHTPLARRGLLAAAETPVAVRPEELLAGMIRSFEAARDAVLSAGAAWARLQVAQERLSRDLTRVEALAREVGFEAHAELGAVRAEAVALESRVARDPLGVAEAYEGALVPRLTELERRVQALRAERESAGSHLEEARARHRELIREQALAAETLERARGELEPPPTKAPPTLAEIQALIPWLGTLEARVGEGKFATAEVGLARFLDAVRRYLTQARAARDASEAALAQREELLGRLSARRAQVDALRAKGAPVDPALEALALEAESLCRRRPTPLAQVSDKVADLEARVASMRRR